MVVRGIIHEWFRIACVNPYPHRHFQLRGTVQAAAAERRPKVPPDFQDGECRRKTHQSGR